MSIRTVPLVLAALVCISPATAVAVEDLEFVAEHLGEVAMDNRYAALPVWPSEPATAWRRTVQAGYSETRTGSLKLAGPTLSLALHRQVNETWSLTGFVFYDDLAFSGRNEKRPLEVRFVQEAPLALPAEAEFANLQGSARNAGVGVGVDHAVRAGPLDGWRWVAGAIWQRFQLENFSTPYVLLSGASAGASGTVDYSTTYDFVTPYAGLSRPMSFGDWAIEPRVLAVVPLPRQGVQGRIVGSGFDLSGDTADAGQGKHYGDPWIALGMAVRYVPWHLDVDVGGVLSQALLEPAIHKGIDRNLALSFSWQF